MRTVFPLLLAFIIASEAEAQQPALREADRVRLAEAFRLAENVRYCVWKGWSDVRFAVLLVTPAHEFLVGHLRPADDFAPVGYDSLLRSAVYLRDRVFSPNLLATFPAVGGVSTVVIGQPEHTGKASTFWVITALHEHFHQFQTGQPGYYDAVVSLDLAGAIRRGCGC